MSMFLYNDGSEVMVDLESHPLDISLSIRRRDQTQDYLLNHYPSRSTSSSDEIETDTY